MRSTRHLSWTSWTLSLLTAAALTACGGGSGDSPTVQVSEAASVINLSVDLDEGATASGVVAQPSFHTAAVDLEEPDNGAAPHRALALSGITTKGLTRERLDDAMRPRAFAAGNGEAAPMASSTAMTVYTPAQIRAAYGQPALPASTAGLTAAQAAQLGAGQTIYIVNAKHDPNIAAELAAFNAKFGLPTCSNRTLAANASLPLAAASSSSCELVIAYSTSAGALTATAPAYDSGWATEIALDVQWAHATAPLARLVLIEAPDAGVSSLSKAVALANRMGAGVVSMSFGASEGSWTSSYDSAFSTAGMSYLAATGDNGAAVSWPSVSTRVVAVGGTTLSYNGSGARSETTWTGTGGGTSAYVALPSYQSGTIGGYAKRAVADVAFNADPNSGQYVALISPGTTTTRWVSAGGTSLATPQWAGLLAVANAMRTASAKSLLGQPHAALYQQIGAVPTSYAAAFKDVASGSNGTCTGCTAKTGYDTPTGWGTPNVSALLTSLSGASATTTSGGSTTTPNTTGPQLTTTSLSGTAGRAFSGTIGYSAPGATSLNISITGAASGMVFSGSSTGLTVAWANPVAGRTHLVITLKDNLGRTTTGTVVVTINTP
ncbi:subtilase family serine protease [Pelomonas saccharophila]|uniref:Subtilase family serine protease n=1 Tax=Roseateles saccharophilus TaxID=304 RepID=A0ABU1YKD4_ROSSA|nr:S53 family peptidase [Roseateles saccharophilus]MDR7269324.1 subtilase family serine protease [Roseateles saccharophilus]